MRVLIAPDSFKGSMTAIDVARNIAQGWAAVRPQDELSCLPMADGGEGTVDALELANPTARRQVARVADPIGRQRGASWLLLPDGTAVVELALACGLPLLSRPAPLHAHTYGFGQLLRAAAGHPEVRRIVAALGGSASTDGGVGALIALGARARDGLGEALPLGGGALRELASLDLRDLVAAPVDGVSCLVDVSSPLLGPTGAAARFGPQKGASPDDIAILESAMTNLASVVGGDPYRAGAGAAGGTAFGLMTVWRARLRGGSDYVAEATGFDRRLATADLVISGEGRLDEQSWSGKVVGHAVVAAARGGVDVALVVGQRSTALPEASAIRACVSLSDVAGDSREALADPARWLVEAGSGLAGEIGG